MMGMTAGGGAQHLRQGVGERLGIPAAADRGAGDDHLLDAGGEGAPQYGLAVSIVAVVGEIDADVDQGRQARCPAHDDRRPSSAVQSASTSWSGWSQETTKRASPESVLPQS